MPPEYVFFASYARIDNPEVERRHSDPPKKERPLSIVVDEIKRLVTQKKGEAVSIFFDTRELSNGVEWETWMSDALQKAGVIVCFCSPAYVKSAFCAKEFEVFRLRFDANGKKQKVILPIVWEPLDAVPAAIKHFYQEKDGRFPSDYYTAGLRRLSSLKSQLDNYMTAIEMIADDIKSGDAAKLKHWPHVVKYDGLPNALHHPKPERYGIVLTTLHDDNSQLKVGQERVWNLIDGLNTGWEEVPADLKRFEDHLKQTEADRHVALIVVKQDELEDGRWKQMLGMVTNGNHKNVAVLVGCDDPATKSPADIAQEIQKQVPAIATTDYFDLDDHETFIAAATRVVSKVQVSMMGDDKPVKVVAPETRESAINDGIPVDSLSTLAPPGSSS